MKNLKVFAAHYDLFPPEVFKVHVRSMRDVENYGKVREIAAMEVLKKHGTKLDLIDIGLSFSCDLRENLWKKTFKPHFRSIEIDESTLTLKKARKKDPKMDYMDFF
jgi:hypothetical protein